MKIALLVRTLFCALAFSAGLSSRGQEIVYDNSTDFSGYDYESVNEFGDEVILAGTARIVTEIQIEYFAQFTAQGDEIGRLRFYANTGPNWNGDPDYPTPASPPLYEQTFPLTNGYNVAIVTVPDVAVPDHFTWTVQFLGISQSSTNDRAGLLYYSVPTVGQSFDDFWELQPAGWAPLTETGVPYKHNFGSRILAVSTAVAQPTLTVTHPGNNVLISWPSTFQNYSLEYKTDLNAAAWTAGPAATPNGANFEVTLPSGTGNQFFRLKSP